MKKIAIVFLLSIYFANSGIAQTIKIDSNNETELRFVLTTFMECLIKKDAERFYRLFNEDPVVWVGVYKEKSQQRRVQKNSDVKKDYKIGDYKSFYKSIFDNNVEEKFYNIVIEEDGYVASITFDYSFWANGKKGNWGKESWGLIKTNGQWKITSVIYSIENESVDKEPLRETRTSLISANGTKSISEKFDAHIAKYIKDEDFQGTILIAQNGKIIHKAAYGLFDRERKRENTIDTQFLIGSLTKSFVGVTVMQLVEEGLLDLTAPIKTYIPNLNEKLAKNLNLHLLLKQQSGLPSSLDVLTTFEKKDITSAELLQIINQATLSFTPGTKYEYSNLNYTLCAMAIENVTAKSYSQILQERTFSPLNMNNSGVERLSNVPKNKAKGYRKKLPGIENEEHIVSYALGSGDIYSTVEDLFKWDQALYNNKLLSAKSKKILFSGESEEFGNYGYGFRIQEYQRSLESKNRGVLIRHGGTFDGFMSNLHRYIDDELTVIILGNIRPFSIRKLTFELKEIALGVELGKRNNSKLE